MIICKATHCHAWFHAWSCLHHTCVPPADANCAAVAGVGLLDQQNSFFGKVLLHVCVFGILIFRTSSDVERYKGLIDEATFYDRQWSATWEGQERPSDK